MEGPQREPSGNQSACVRRLPQVCLFLRFLVLLFDLCGRFSSDAGVQKERFSVKLPRVPGHEIVGEIVVLGPGETHFKIGQRVGGGWHGGHCGRCKNCSVGDFTTCELQAINGMPRASAAFHTLFIIRIYAL